jgi:hypothetical protein
MVPKKLPADVEAAMRECAVRGRTLWGKGDIAGAESALLQAWDTLPMPTLENDYAQSMAWGFVGFYRDTKQFDKAQAWLATTRKAYGGGPNPSVDFLEATVLFDAGREDEAYRIFDGLHEKYGRRPFEGEDQKYLAFYRSRSLESCPSVIPSFALRK